MASSGIVDLVRGDDDFEKDLKEAIAASLAQTRPSGESTPSHSAQ